jgi:hypothetical protein
MMRRLLCEGASPAGLSPQLEIGVVTLPIGDAPGELRVTSQNLARALHLDGLEAEAEMG